MLLEPEPLCGFPMEAAKETIRSCILKEGDELWKRKQVINTVSYFVNSNSVRSGAAWLRNKAI